MEQNLRYNEKELDRDFITKLREEIKREILEETTKRHCPTCAWFKFRADRKHGNRVCQYPEKLRWKGMLCLMWKLEPDPKRRRRGLC